MSLKTAFFSIIAVFCVAFVFISIISDDFPRAEGKKRQEARSAETPKKKEPRPYLDDFGNENEVSVGGKRFKLFEKKKLNHKKAQAFCKKQDGKLAEAMNLEEMRRLQVLLMRAKTVGDDMWIGADKKEWKKHSLKVQKKPNFGSDSVQMFGGGPTEMCPALSVSTRSLAPVMCIKELAFICEFESGKPKPKAVKTTTAKTKTESSSNKARGQRTKRKVEMRKKRQVLLTDIIPTSVTIHNFPSPPSDISVVQSGTINNENVQASSSQAGEGDDDDDDGDDDDNAVTEVTEIYVTENPEVEAAEHNIGFSPHVEHMLTEERIGESLQPSPADATVASESESRTSVDENSIQKMMETPQFLSTPIQIQVKVSTKITVEKDQSTGQQHKGSNPYTKKPTITTTLDPDQQLIDLIDEQTMNLTAIEMEGMNNINNNSVTSNSLIENKDNIVEDMKGALKIPEFIDDNELATLPSTSVLEEDKSENKSRKAKMTITKKKKKKDYNGNEEKRNSSSLRSSTFDFGDNSTTLFDYYRDENTNGSSSNEIESLTMDVYNLTDSFDIISNGNISSNRDKINQLNAYYPTSTPTPYPNVDDDDDDDNNTTEIILENRERNRRPIRNASHTDVLVSDKEKVIIYDDEKNDTKNESIKGEEKGESSTPLIAIADETSVNDTYEMHRSSNHSHLILTTSNPDSSNTTSNSFSFTTSTALDKEEEQEIISTKTTNSNNTFLNFENSSSTTTTFTLSQDV